MIRATSFGREMNRYEQSGSITEYKEFAGRTHYTVIAGEGWEEVADYAVNRATRVTSAREELGTQGLAANRTARLSTPEQPDVRAGA